MKIEVNIHVSVEFIRNDCPQSLSSSVVSAEGHIKSKTHMKYQH